MLMFFLTKLFDVNFIGDNLDTITAYDILRDTILIVIGIIAAAAAIIGVSLYFALRRTLESEITKKAEQRISQECRKIRGQSDIQAGVIDWIGKRLNHAINKTNKALREAEDVLEETNIVWAKSNLGFYYAELHRQKPSEYLKDKSIELTKIGYDLYNPQEACYNNPDWVDNYLFVRVTFVSDNNEKSELLKEISELMTRDDLQSIKGYLEEYKTELSKRNF